MDDFDYEPGTVVPLYGVTSEELLPGLEYHAKGIYRAGYDFKLINMEEFNFLEDEPGLVLLVREGKSKRRRTNPLQEYLSPEEMWDIERNNILALIKSECIIGGYSLEETLSEQAKMYQLPPWEVLLICEIMDTDFGELCGLASDVSWEELAKALNTSVKYLEHLFLEETDEEEEFTSEEVQGGVIYLDEHRTE